MKFSFSAGDKPLEGITIKRAIYRGGFGEVYYARTDSGKEVALKLLNENREVELRGLSQCLNLKHPNLVTLFDIKTDREGDHWVVMEYISGPTLAEYLKKHPDGLPEEEVLKIFDQISEGLEFLHARSLVHRDLKPANIFLDATAAKIGDVGLSKFIGPSRRSAQTQSVGTVHYMAPEVAKGQYGQEVDLYALGIILYEMLTGKLPFDGESTGEILMKHLTQKPDLSLVQPRFQAVLSQALEKDESRRFRSVKEFREALKELFAQGRFRQTGEDAGVPQQGAGNSREIRREKRRERRQKFFDSFRKESEPSPVPLAQHSQQQSEAGSAWWIVALAGILFVLLPMVLQYSQNSRAVIWLKLLLIGGLGWLSWLCIRNFYRGRGQDALVRKEPVPATQTPGDRSWFSALSSRLQKPHITERTIPQRVSGMFRAMSLVPFLTSLIAGTICLFSPSFFASKSLTPGQIDFSNLAFFVSASTFAVWILLAVTTFQRERVYDPTGKRLTLLLAGMFCGLGVFGMSELYQVQFTDRQFSKQNETLLLKIGRFPLFKDVTRSEKMSPLPVNSIYEVRDPNILPDGVRMPPHASPEEIVPAPWKTGQAGIAPVDDQLPHEQSETPQTITLRLVTPAGFMVFFGALFSLRSWYRLAHYRREYQGRFESALLSALVAYFICLLFTFPMAWGITIAAVITVSLQISAPRTSEQRKRLLY